MESYYPGYSSDAIHVKPSASHMQKDAITDSWCQVLSKACKDLWHAHHGCHVQVMIVHVGDDIAVESRDSVEPFEQSDEGRLGDNLIAPSSVDNLFTPFTCNSETAGQTIWSTSRQSSEKRSKRLVAEPQSKACCFEILIWSVFVSCS